MYRRILVPTDGSELAQLAANAAISFAQAGGGEIVARVVDTARRAGVVCTSVTAYGYSRADEIVEVSKRQHCDLIFIASHGRRGLSRLIAGSVTQRVLAYSPVPVMVYRPHIAHARGRLPQDSSDAMRAPG
ncbi:universal stress protein [Massilia sp. Mn16-1_5]|uniref:universal stress protein n=1 Tax=Massilia sp. Mn16-1_5 TaxID=2079199 RepID=UPI00109ECCF0|nr:universal stress protein [Massilia sp. Mn16-1_5]THC46669.1 universal stress protein UspA [Massilia sp. Mn16-1_5]